jgi:ATP-binding cassette subfamily B protein
LKAVKKLRYVLFLYKPYLKYGKLYVALTFVLEGAIAPLVTLLTALLPEKAINTIIAQESTTRLLVVVGSLALVLLLLNFAHIFISMFYIAPGQRRIKHKLERDLYEKGLRSDFKYYDNPEFYSKFAYSKQLYPDQARQVAELFPSLIKSVITVLAMGALVAQAGVALFGITLVFIAVQMLLTKSRTKNFAEFSVLQSEMGRKMYYVARVIEKKENAAELRASAAGEKLLSQYVKSMDEYGRVERKFIFKQMRFTVPQNIVASLQSPIVLLYIFLFVVSGDISKIGLYASLSVAAASLSAALNSFLGDFMQLYQKTILGEKIAEFFEAKSVIEPPEANAGKADAPGGAYEAELRDVTFGYEGSPFSINKLNLKIPRGGRIAIVGENGAGKSTLMKLLTRLYDPSGGAVLINGKDIRDYDIHRLRRRIGVAHQDICILAVSLRENLTVYHDASDEEINAVIEKLGLGDVVAKVGGKLDTMVSREFTEDGAVLSGGEAQRLAVARLFIGDFGLLLLDEPSSALDPLSEYNLMKTILDVSNTATTIMVAHRLSTVRDFDVIYHMEGGKIIESGTHDELMTARGGYYEMFTRQAENYQLEGQD